jgi:tRNA-2-methylthio-N6-dimethylallyladenosine synthase
MNKLDTALVTAALKQARFEIIEDPEYADVVLINTCSVREHAEQKVLSNLGYLKHKKQSKPDLVVGVIGCMAQRLGNELLDQGNCDIVVGPAQIPQIVEYVRKALEQKQSTLAVTERIRTCNPENPQLEDFESTFDSDDKQIPGQAFIRAMRGCNNFCTYCIVPYVRGPEVSRPPKLIVEQAKRLADEGVKLITLLGQTVNSYEYKQGDKTYCLADIFEITSQIEGIEWIRFVTNYPSEKYFTQICQAMRDLPKICNYLHMPAQSGSDTILRAMNRHYTRDQYLDLLQKAREIVPNIAIAGDFIVGFPNESDDDFEQTVELVKKAQYKNCFVFKYSPRPGTASDKRLEDNIPDNVKKIRNTELLTVQETISDKISSQFLNNTVKVLVEGLSKKPHLNKAQNQNHPQLISRTADDWIVVFNGPETLAGSFCEVKINKTSPLTLFGKLL